MSEFNVGVCKDNEVMKVGYELYKRMGFEEIGEKDGIVSMRMGL